MNQVGIVIPTKNRYPQLEKLIKYYVGLNSEVTLYIGDSSDDGSIHDSFKLCNENSNGKTKIVFKEFPEKSAEKTIKELVQTVETRYCCFSGDDDYFVPDTLKKAAEFLNQSPDYSTVNGKGLIMSIDKNLIIYDSNNYYLNGCEKSTPEDRLKYLLNNYWVLQFSLHKTEIFKKCTQNLDRFSDRNFTEILSNCISIVLGKAKQLDELYLVRVDHSERCYLPASLDWVTGPEWNKSYWLFHEILVEYLISYTKFNADESSFIVSSAFSNYLNTQLGKVNIKRNESSEIKSILQQLGMFNRVKNIYNYFFRPYSLNSLTSKKSSYYKHFMPIYEIQKN